MNSLQQRFKSILADDPLVAGAKDSLFILAVSGGVDSVVLCDLFSASGYNYVIAHCNFQLRGAESERDENFVRALAEGYDKQLFVQRFDTELYATEHKLSIQVAARNLRYDWFRTLLQTENKRGFIVTAHHADDNIETVVMNFFRGTGLKGLAGMDTHFQDIYRPLLSFRKSELLAYATEKQLAFVEDSSNISSNYTRNYFRNELLPAVEKVFPQVEQNLLNNIRRMSEAEQVFEHTIQLYRKRLVHKVGNAEHIPILLLQKIGPVRTIVWELIKDKGFTAAQADEVVKLLGAENGSYITSASHRVLKHRKWLIISESVTIQPETVYVLEQGDKQVQFEKHTIQLKLLTNIKTNNLPEQPEIAVIDAGEVHFPLLVRRWKTGDYFYPLGMQKKKKISRFLIDRKLSKLDKENTWVLESNKKIIWVIGQRLDDRFKVKASTTKALQFTYLSN